MKPHLPTPLCRTPARICAASTGLPILDGLYEEQAPAIFALRRKHEAFKSMRQVQKEILTVITQRLSIRPVPTTVSDDGLAYFTTPDKQTSIALQVGYGMLSRSGVTPFCRRTSAKFLVP